MIEEIRRFQLPFVLWQSSDKNNNTYFPTKDVLHTVPQRIDATLIELLTREWGVSSLYSIKGTNNQSEPVIKNTKVQISKTVTDDVNALGLSAVIPFY